MRITNASYDVREITVNKIQIENEISQQPRSSLWILNGRYKLHVCKTQGAQSGGEVIENPKAAKCNLSSYIMNR